MNIHNLTPHEVVIMAEDGNILAVIPPTGQVARASQTDTPSGEVEINGVSVPVVMTGYGEVSGLPEPTEGVVFVVSALTAIAARAQGRSVEDLLLTSSPVRDETGRIIGCRQLARP